MILLLSEIALWVVYVSAIIKIWKLKTMWVVFRIIIIVIWHFLATNLIVIIKDYLISIY